MLVAFESLTKATPCTAPTGSSACSRPVKRLAGAGHRIRRSRRRSRPPPPPRRRRRAGAGRSAAPPTAAPAARRDPRGDARSPRPSTTTPSSIAPDGLSADAARARVPRERHRRRIVDVDDRPVVRLLVGEDPRLRLGVLLDARVPIEVIGREVEQHGNPRPELLGHLELKAARLDHVHDVAATSRSTCALSGMPMLPPTIAAHAALVQHPSHQRRRRRLALGAGDRDDASRQPARRRARARRSSARRPRAPRRRRAGAATRPGSARSDRRRAASDGDGRPARAPTPELAQPLGAVEVGFHVGQHHARSTPHQQLRRRDAAPRRSHHHDALPLDTEHHRSFNVARLHSANTIATIRKRVITFGSLQPTSSKW